MPDQIQETELSSPRKSVMQTGSMRFSKSTPPRSRPSSNRVIGGENQHGIAGRMTAVEAPIFDAVGNPVTAATAREAFRSLKLFDEIEQRLRNALAKALLLAESKGGAYLPIERITAEINNALNAVNRSRPYALHDECGGQGCKACRHSGYVTKFLFEHFQSTSGQTQVVK